MKSKYLLYDLRFIIYKLNSIHIFVLKQLIQISFHSEISSDNNCRVTSLNLQIMQTGKHKSPKHVIDTCHIKNKVINSENVLPSSTQTIVSFSTDGLTLDFCYTIQLTPYLLKWSINVKIWLCEASYIPHFLWNGKISQWPSFRFAN